MSDLAFDDKQPYEAYYVQFDFVSELGVGDSIESTVVTAKNGDTDVTSTLTDSTPVISGTAVKVWVRAGTTGITYVITCKIVTVNNEQYEAEADLIVLEK